MMFHIELLYIYSIFRFLRINMINQVYWTTFKEVNEARHKINYYLT